MSNRHTGFTLVEILIVVVILAILAAIALPGLSNASALARASMLADDLRVIRVQLMTFRGQHLGLPAGYPPDGGAPSEAQFVNHMTLASNEAGYTAPPGTAGFRYGPYLREIPANPVNGLSTVRVLDDNEAMPADPSNQHGWIYHPATATFRADNTGQDENGVRFFDY